MRIWERLEGLLERFAPTVLGFLLIYVFSRSVRAGTGSAYWLDELLTQLVTSQGSLSDIMEALHAPMDGQPRYFM